ncbi:MAG: 2-succinyl-5-enolpyruvyl-6-hydroxy-3-cyclohexene-1-carboxylic-acid synthase [Opitutaceae bacterium]|nr:2-succinyl-5-enolpyruvyl-6-hydroxy-3-cyclohexene-1-carboxylic-acid synthase [Opitutaceae bacterium]
MASVAIDFRNTNSLWGSVLVETLARLGLREAVLSPGSRSTPLTFAFARHPRIEAIPVLDERSAAFFALGLAKQHQRPVALVCTSGTAAANYYPALIEAHESGVPLIVLTGDRPPELRDCHSGQAIDQQKIYGGYVNFYHELAVPEAKLDLLRYLRQTVAQAFARTLLPGRGPVHLNCPFRDPLVPLADGVTAGLGKQISKPAFFGHLRPVVSPSQPGIKIALPKRRGGCRGIIVAGPAAPENVTRYVTKLRALAVKLGWPVLADVLSPVRHRSRHDLPMITAYDAILRSPRLARRLHPEVVLCLEGWPTSKVLRGWLQETNAETWLVHSGKSNVDGLHGRTHAMRGDVTGLLVESGPTNQNWLHAWLVAETRARDALVKRVEACGWLFEGRVSQMLPGLLPAGTPVFVASSMPVRDTEYFWPATKRRHVFHFNRGANGIDGTLSTALGMAHAAGRPAVLLTGDLALLHDTNGFLLRPKFGGSLTIVLINNRGGGIFEHLPVAAIGPAFEEFFATPQEADFGRLCAAYGVGHVLVRDWPHFGKLVSKLPRTGLRVLELRTDRKRDAAFRKKLFADVAAALG